MNSLKKIAAALITSLALAGTAHTADLPVATDRLPDELLDAVMAPAQAFGKGWWLSPV